MLIVVELDVEDFFTDCDYSIDFMTFNRNCNPWRSFMVDVVVVTFIAFKIRENIVVTLQFECMRFGIEFEDDCDVIADWLVVAC